jgi:hypothetical protein
LYRLLSFLTVYGHYLDTKRVVWVDVKSNNRLLDNQMEGSPNGMAVDLKSTVRKDLRVRILRPPLKYSLKFVSLEFEDPFPSQKTVWSL